MTIPFVVFHNLIVKKFDIQSAASFSQTCTGNFSAMENNAEWLFVKTMRLPHVGGLRFVDAGAPHMEKLGDNVQSVCMAASHLRLFLDPKFITDRLNTLNELGKDRIATCFMAARILNIPSLQTNSWHSLYNLLIEIRSNLCSRDNQEDICAATQIVLQWFDPTERLDHSCKILGSVLRLKEDHSAICSNAKRVFDLCKQYNFLRLEKELGPETLAICAAAAPLITLKMKNDDVLQLLYSARKLTTEDFNTISPSAVGLIRHGMSIHECSLIFDALKRLKDQAVSISALVQKTGLVNDSMNVNNICTILDLVSGYGPNRDAICAEAKGRIKEGMNFILLKSLLETISKKHIGKGKQ